MRILGLLFIFGVLINTRGYTQIEKGTLTITPSIGLLYEELHAEEQTDPNHIPLPNRNETSMEVSLRIGYTLTENMTIGVLARYASFRQASNIIRVNPTTNTGFIEYTGGLDFVDVTSDLTLGIYTSRFTPLAERFYLIPTFNIFHHSSKNGRFYPDDSGALIAESDLHSGVLVFDEETGELVPYIPPESTDPSAKFSSTINYLGAEFTASILYKINNWIGIQVQVFSMNYRWTYNAVTTNSHFTILPLNREFNTTFNPLNWRLGITLFL